MELKEPVKVKESDLYAVVLEDADGIVHYWHLNGDYDGYCMPHELPTTERSLGSPST